MKSTSSLLSSSLLLLILGWSLPKTANAQSLAEALTQVIHLKTSLDHITVLEFDEPVVQAASGSPAFNIEWHDNKLLIKPLKAGASTDLLVWTASRRFAYELDPPGEVKNMTVALDASTPKPVLHKDDAMNMVADMALTHALMGSDRINNRSIKDQKGRVVVRIETVFESSDSTYIRYGIKNLGDHPYRIVAPEVHQLTAVNSQVSLVSLQRTQLDSDALKKLDVKQRSQLLIASAQLKSADLSPGDETHGVVVLRQRFPAATVLELTFSNSGAHHVSATFVY
jgi:hypothetical protein